MTSSSHGQVRAGHGRSDGGDVDAKLPSRLLGTWPGRVDLRELCVTHRARLRGYWSSRSRRVRAFRTALALPSLLK